MQIVAFIMLMALALASESLADLSAFIPVAIFTLAVSALLIEKSRIDKTPNAAKKRNINPSIEPRTKNVKGDKP